jgi:peroxiredoxin (alkyl hydroperoxide reductase subunit C)
MRQLVGQKAPDFKVQGVSPEGEIKTYQLADFEGKYVVLFFYPLDFTFVCPLELLEMSKLATSFEQENAVVLGISIDSVHTHAAWRQTAVSQGGIGQLSYPLLSDVNRELIEQYGVANADPKVALRATVIIDTKGVVRTYHVNDLPIGRNPQEVLRLVKSIEFHDQHGDVCPPNWEPGSQSLKPTAEGLKAYLADVSESA